MVDPYPPPTRRHRTQLVQALQAMEAPTPGAALAALLALESPYGIERRAFALAWNLVPQALEDAQQQAAATMPHALIGEGDAALWFTQAQLTLYEERITEALEG